MPLRLLLSLLGGTFITLALAPFNWVPLVFLAPACLYFAMRDCSPSRAALLGWLFGCALFGTGSSWVFVSIHEHSATPLPIALLLTALFVTVLALLFALQAYIWRRWFYAGLPISGFMGCWLLFEWVRSWLFTGFPWLYLGYATLDTPLANWLPIGGIWLGSFAVLLISAGLIQTLQQRQPLWLLLAALPWVCLLLPTQWTTQAPRELSVALVQPNIPQNDKWVPENRSWILQRYMDLTRPHTSQQLIVWPETAVPAFFNQTVDTLAPLLDQLDQQGTTLLSGMPTLARDSDRPKGYRVHNSLVLLTGSSGVYHKQRLVPFGEYLPLEYWLRGLVAFFNLPMSSFSLPKEPQSLLKADGFFLSAAICYEIAYPGLVREMSRNADIMLTVSNDTWFGDSIAPAQHLQIARARALENGRWLIRGTNSGITALINPQGKVTARLPQFETGVLSGRVTATTGLTPYQRLGDWLVLSLMILLLLGSTGRLNRLLRHHTPG